LAPEARGKAEGLRDLHLLLDSAEVALIAGIDVGGFRLELAVDSVLRDEALYLPHARLLRFGIKTRASLAEPGLARGATADAPSANFSIKPTTTPNTKLGAIQVAPGVKF